MTTAICIRCGKNKSGAFALSSQCGFLPAAPEDMARSLILSDRQSAEADLLRHAETLLKGGVIDYPEDQVRGLSQAIAQSGVLEPAAADRWLPGLLLGWAILLGLAIAAAVIWIEHMTRM